MSDHTLLMRRINQYEIAMSSRLSYDPLNANFRSADCLSTIRAASQMADMCSKTGQPKQRNADRLRSLNRKARGMFIGSWAEQA